jgi:MOSC domain-containing protein YiiM
MAGRLDSVNVVSELRDDPNGDVGRTAIDKRPVEGGVLLTVLGPAGDVVVDRESHGGYDQAVYAYAKEDLDEWARELDRTLTPGQFGENLTTVGVDVTGAVIGEIWTIGEARLQVRAHRTPCATFQYWLNEPQWVKRFTIKGAPGAYLKVLQEGLVSAGDEVVVSDRPAHGVTIGEVFAGRRGDKERLALLLNEPDLADEMMSYLKQELAVGS